MNYIQHLLRTYKGVRTLSLGKSVEDFLNANLDPSIPQSLDFNELDRALQVVPPTGYEDFICKKLSPLEGLERWSISSGRKKNFLVVVFNPNTSSYRYITDNPPHNLICGMGTLVLLSQKMQKDLAIRVLPLEIRVMS